MKVALDPWLGMAFGMQALRQVASCDDGALLGALGAGAEPLPHQMATVERILTAPEIRHLIADEVGLGKTIQSLMIVNALHLVDPKHRTLVVAPDFLLEQWASEFSTRCNISPTVRAEGREDADYENAPLVLIRPGTLTAPNFLDRAVDDFDLLIVDEPQALTEDQRDTLARTRFASTLLLSATPGFGNPRMRQQILRLIEPDRTESALLNESPAEMVIAADEAAARHALLAGEGDPATIWAAQALGRRICRWTRRDWPEITPARVVQRIVVPPFGHESVLIEKATELLNRPVNDAVERNRLSLRAQRLHRLGEPARDAMKELGAPYPTEDGDTHFDALLDRLLIIWEDDPEARVVVVVGDNPTIDRLTSRLESYFPEAGPVAQVRRTRAISSETEAMTTAFDQLDGYRQGRSRLLLLGDWAEAGLNLHYGTREIIFYACPWSIRAVDQLTGRLDRLAKGAERHIRSRKTRREIGVSVIAWQGSPEARVVEAIASLGIFERPRASVSEETQQAIEDDLYACATGRGYRAALDRLASLAVEDVFALSDPVLATADPYDRGHALALYKCSEMATEAVPGALPSPMPENNGVRAAAENAIDGWLKAMRVAEVFRISTRADAESPQLKGILLWYPDTVVRGDVTRPIMLPTLETTGKHYPNYDDGAAAFIARRRHLAVPPAINIAPENLRERALRFFDHGNALHGELCSALIAHGRGSLDGSRPPYVAVTYPPGHPFNDKNSEPMIVACALERGHPRIVTDTERKFVLGDCDKRDHGGALRLLKAGLAADARWRRRQSPARFMLAGIRCDREVGTWVKMPEEMCVSALDPRGEGKTTGQCHKATMAERKLLAAGMTHLTDLLAIDRCTPDAAVFNARKMLIEADLVHAVRALRARKARDVESNRQVRNVAEGLARRYDARIAATKRVAQIRCFQLEKGWKTTSEIRCLAIHPRPRQDV